MRKSKAPAQIIQGLESGIQCLLYLVSQGRPTGSRELARKLDLEPTRVNRLLKTLAHMGFAAQTVDKKYVAGNGINILAALSMRSSPLLRIALPHVVALSETLHQNVALGVLWEDQVCYLYHGQGSDFVISGNALYPAEQSSIGLSLLAYYSDEEINELYPGSEQVSAQICDVRTRGYAVGKTGSIAVCIGGDLQLGGLAVSQFDEKKDSLDDILHELNACAEKISHDWRNLNGTPSQE